MKFCFIETKFRFIKTVFRFAEMKFKLTYPMSKVPGNSFLDERARVVGKQNVKAGKGQTGIRVHSEQC